MAKLYRDKTLPTDSGENGGGGGGGGEQKLMRNPFYSLEVWRVEGVGGVGRGGAYRKTLISATALLFASSYRLQNTADLQPAAKIAFKASRIKSSLVSKPAIAAPCMFM